MKPNRLFDSFCGLALLSMLGGLWLWACSPSVSCKSDTECKTGSYCGTDKQCTSDCTQNTDCKTTERCSSTGKCQSIVTEQPVDDGGLPDAISENEPFIPENPIDPNPPDQVVEEEGIPETITNPEGTNPEKSPLCPVESRECYSGPVGTAGKGSCKAGKQRCIDGNWGPCVGEVTPKTEQCNGIDDNCDGVVDPNCTVWATSAGGKDGDEGSGIAVDGTGNIYATGTFYGTATFGSFTLLSKGESDIYVAKLDAKGQFLWALGAGGSTFDAGKSIAADATGNSYIAGLFEGTATVGTLALTSQGGKNLYVAKLDTTGQVLWASAAGGATGGVEVGTIVVDGSGNSYIVGSFADSATFGTIALSSKGGNDVFVAKVDTTGQFLWAVSAGGKDNEDGVGITVDATGNTYITGSFEGSSSFGTSTITASSGYQIYVAKLNPTGQFLWVTPTRNSWYSMGAAIAVDGSGNSYITGVFEESATFGTIALTSGEGSDIYVAKLNPTGQFLWAVSATGYWNSPGKNLGIDGLGNLYITGSFAESIPFGSKVIYGKGALDIYTAKLDSSGRFLSAVAAGGQNYDSGDAVAVDKAGNTYITGSFRETATFNSTTLTSKGYTDIFVAKILAN